MLATICDLIVASERGGKFYAAVHHSQWKVQRIGSPAATHVWAYRGTVFRSWVPSQPMQDCSFLQQRQVFQSLYDCFLHNHRIQ